MYMWIWLCETWEIVPCTERYRDFLIGLVRVWQVTPVDTVA